MSDCDFWLCLPAAAPKLYFLDVINLDFLRLLNIGGELGGAPSSKSAELKEEKGIRFLQIKVAFNAVIRKLAYRQAGKTVGLSLF